MILLEKANCTIPQLSAIAPRQMDIYVI